MFTWDFVRSNTSFPFFELAHISYSNEASGDDKIVSVEEELVVDGLKKEQGSPRYVASIVLQGFDLLSFGLLRMVTRNALAKRLERRVKNRVKHAGSTTCQWFF